MAASLLTYRGELYNGNIKGFYNKNSLWHRGGERNEVARRVEGKSKGLKVEEKNSERGAKLNVEQASVLEK